jgi:predicted Ser/Thr protein kinase
VIRLSPSIEEEIVRSIEGGNSARIGHGYQGAIYLHEIDGQRCVIKAAIGRGLLRAVRVRMLRNEFAAYQRLEGFSGSPRCYGFVNDKYLVLQYVDGRSVRHAPITNPPLFFEMLFRNIVEMHRRGIAHADLKRKDNLLVIGGERPCIVDFGTAIIRKEAFAPLNHFLFKLACQFDLNAWIKLKYRKRMGEISPADRVYYHRTIFESSLREAKRVYKRLRRKLFPGAQR